MVVVLSFWFGIVLDHFLDLLIDFVDQLDVSEVLILELLDRC